MARRKLFERIHLRFEIERAFLRDMIAYVPRPLYSRHLLMFIGSTVLATIVTLFMLDHQPREIAFMSGIFVLAALLWVTEALPLFATALVIIGLEIILLANPGQWSWLWIRISAGARLPADFKSLVRSYTGAFSGRFHSGQSGSQRGSRS